MIIKQKKYILHFSSAVFGENWKYCYSLGVLVVVQKLSFGKGRKNCGKRKKCWLPAFSPFPTIFSNGFYVRVVNVGIVCERVKEAAEDRV